MLGVEEDGPILCGTRLEAAEDRVRMISLGLVFGS